HRAPGEDGIRPRGPLALEHRDRRLRRKRPHDPEVPEAPGPDVDVQAPGGLRRQTRLRPTSTFTRATGRRAGLPRTPRGWSARPSLHPPRQTDSHTTSISQARIVSRFPTLKVRSRP